MKKYKCPKCKSENIEPTLFNMSVASPYSGKGTFYPLLQCTKCKEVEGGGVCFEEVKYEKD